VGIRKVFTWVGEVEVGKGKKDNLEVESCKEGYRSIVGRNSLAMDRSGK
jgi:hypothetical protein